MRLLLSLLLLLPAAVVEQQPAPVCAGDVDVLVLTCRVLWLLVPNHMNELAGSLASMILLSCRWCKTGMLHPIGAGNIQMVDIRLHLPADMREGGVGDNYN